MITLRGGVTAHKHGWQPSSPGGPKRSGGGAERLDDDRHAVFSGACTNSDRAQRDRSAALFDSSPPVCSEARSPHEPGPRSSTEQELRPRLGRTVTHVHRGRVLRPAVATVVALGLKHGCPMKELLMALRSRWVSSNSPEPSLLTRCEVPPIDTRLGNQRAAAEVPDEPSFRESSIAPIERQGS